MGIGCLTRANKPCSCNTTRVTDPHALVCWPGNSRPANHVTVLLGLLCAGQVVFSSYYRLYRMAQAPAGGEGDRPGTGGGGGVCNLLPLYDFIPERMDIDDYQVNVGDSRRMGMPEACTQSPRETLS